ncbi:MAG: T9SS type A sorting domain-containing protein [Dysgonomonas sp.]|nr:T9SS type A sorting domain-containing protein [Dysgonomonas sp.]
MQKYIKSLFVILILLFIGIDASSQSEQVLNPNGGKSVNFDDGLKIKLTTDGALHVYRRNISQYYSGYTFPSTGGSSVKLNFCFDDGTTFSTAKRTLTACSTTTAAESGGVWTTSISGYVTSSISGEKFYVTINIKYTTGQTYFLVDYYVRAPSGLSKPETVHIYLDHDAYVLGYDQSTGYRNVTTTGEFVGDYRTAAQTPTSGCSSSGSNHSTYPRSPSCHGFKTKGGFRSHYTAGHSGRATINAQLMLQNKVNSSCIDDGIAVEFVLENIAAGQTKAKQVLHGYGHVGKGEFDNTVVTDPIVKSGSNKSVKVDFTSATFNVAEGNATNKANITIKVSEGFLVENQICNFSISGGNAVANTDYSFAKGFIIPAGDYSTPKTFTLNNVDILGNTVCNGNRTFNMSIDNETCNDLVTRGSLIQTTVTIVDDDIPTVNNVASKTYCNGTSVPANTFVFTGSTLPNTTYNWVVTSGTAASIGLSASSGSGNLPAFTTNNTSTTNQTVTITVTPTQNTCSGTAKTFTITVYPEVKSGAIGGNQTICYNTVPATITGAVSTGGNGAYTYQWQSSANGTSGWTNITGATGLTYTPPALTTTTYYRRTTVNTCKTVYSTVTTITVRPNLVSGTIGGNQTICYNATPATITGNASTGGSGVYTYQWQSSANGTSGWTNITGATGVAYSPGVLTSTTYYRRMTNDNALCGPVYSTVTAITVRPQLVVGSISGAQTICHNTAPNQITGTAGSGGDGNIKYQWQSSANGTSGWVNITGATAMSYTPGVLTTTTYYRREVKDGASCGTLYSNVIQITVRPQLVVGSISGAQTICHNTAPNQITGTAGSGGDGNIKYQWQSSANGTSGWANITGATAISYTPGVLTTTTYYRREVKDGASCGTLYSNVIQITVRPQLIVGSISGAQTICYNTTPAAITGTASTGGDGNIKYQWQSSTNGTSGWANITGATAISYSPGVLTATTYYRRETKDGASCGTLYSNVIQITVHPQVQVGSINGNPFTCAGVAPLIIKGTASSGGSSLSNLKYQWQSKVGGGSWTDISGATSQNYTPTVALTGDTYFRRVTTDSFCNTIKHYSNEFLIKVVATPTTLYWNQNATDNNWNNPLNWLNAQTGGVSVGMVPLACTDVHILGTTTTKYPSLDSNTPTDVYGVPVCKNITFHYGAELAFQHKLTYEKAHVQYNWGYYNNASPISNSQPSNNASGASCSKKKRDTWYALAAPLKSMASGDFSFAGYPLTWQGGFAVSHPVSGNSPELTVGDFSKAFAKNDVNLATTNNAIAVKVALYKNSTIGHDDHCNLEGLKGIIEIPYFEDPVKDALFAAHDYDKFTGESRFYYFNPNTLQIIHDPVGRMKRGDEAYRFIYEEKPASTWQAPTITVEGVDVAGYKKTVERTSTSSQKVMIGNPFMASINAYHFYEANKTKLNNVGYEVYNSSTQTWSAPKTYVAANNIAPLQAFIITLADNVTTADLLFPLEGTRALTGIGFRGQPLMLPEGRSLYIKTIVGDVESDYAVLDADSEKTLNLKKMIHPDGHATPEVFFVSGNGSDFNIVQYFDNGVNELAMGVKCSDTTNPIKLIFDNVGEFTAVNYMRPVLVDKHLGTEQDLTLNNTYQFTQRKTEEANQYIDADRFSLRLVSGETIIDSKKDDITIVYYQGQLAIESTQDIKHVEVYDMYGRLVHIDKGVNINPYIKSLALAKGVYVVKVQTVNGRTKVEKISVL